MSFFCLLEVAGCSAATEGRPNFSEQAPSSVTVPEAGMAYSSLAPAAGHMSLGLEFEDIHAYKQVRKEGGVDAACAGFRDTYMVPILHLPLPDADASGKLRGFPQPPFSSL